MSCRYQKCNSLPPPPHTPTPLSTKYTDTSPDLLLLIPTIAYSPQSATRIPGYKERLGVLQQLTGYTSTATATANGNGNAGVLETASDVALQEMRQLQNTTRHNELRKDLLQGSSPPSHSLSYFVFNQHRC